MSARLGELYRLDAVLAAAARTVERGWLQRAWFAYIDPVTGRRVIVVAPHARPDVTPDRVVATCLVSAIVNAGGGPTAARSQLVQRAIDLSWHACFRGAGEPIRWCPSPTARAGHVVDLVGWNDQPGRTSHDVVALLDRARAVGRDALGQLRDFQHAP